MNFKFPKPDLVIFDLDNTLYKYGPSHRKGLQSVSDFAWTEYSIPTKLIKKEYEIARSRVKARVNGASSHNRLLYFSELINQLEYRLDVDVAMTCHNIYWTAYFSEMKLSEGAQEFLRSLRHRGVQLALVTDNIAQIQYKKLSILKIEKLFDYVITSEECSNEKISMEPYRLLFKRMRTTELECLWFIGDEIQDWPSEVSAKTKIFLASPYAKRVPKGVKKIQTYKDLSPLLY
jgi:putative hydrolase of the HAD superfamily